MRTGLTAALPVVVGVSTASDVTGVPASPGVCGSLVAGGPLANHKQDNLLMPNLYSFKFSKNKIV
jgi:hypothetical protein